MPQVEETLAGYLSPGSSSLLKKPALPTKPCRLTSLLVGKAFQAAGQAGAALHTMGVLQAYQADLLKDLSTGRSFSEEAFLELRRATDLSLRATKQTARSIGRSMAAMVAAERHLWLNLTGMKDRDKIFLLDAPVSSSGLFGDSVNTVVSRFREAKRHKEAFDQFLPRRGQVSGLSCSPARQSVRLLQPILSGSQERWGAASNFGSSRDAYFHVEILPQHRNFLRFAFGGEAYQYRVLPFGLALSPRTYTKCMDAALAPLRLQGIHILNYIDDWLILARSQELALRHRDVVLAHLRSLGLRLNSKKSVLSPAQRTMYLGVSFRSHGSCIHSDTFEPSAHETVSVVAQSQGISSKGQFPEANKGYAPGASYPFYVVQTPVSDFGSHSRSVLLSQDANDRRFPHGLGCGLKWPSSPRDLEKSSSQLAHQSPRNDGCILGPEILPPAVKRLPCHTMQTQFTAKLFQCWSSFKRNCPQEHLLVLSESMWSLRLHFAPGLVKAILHPHPNYLPKVPFSTINPVILEAFCPPPFSSPEQERLDLLCPTMSHWVRDAIAVAYEVCGQASPLELRAHSARGAASSTAIARGAPLKQVCDAAGWSSPHKFIRFYSLDVHATPGLQVLESTSQSHV
ncbi:Transposon Ty3-G Gag-Pol polyprotein [Labeo rohita]|uniref:ribonuclease H n=1 Tax=Labeo rohita TaxID=84645 RepID=A0ABQ8L946_LABRO|nr:Transposon Ty3-G Gag-Pol polyprotein [Labeo rohita]